MSPPPTTSAPAPEAAALSAPPCATGPTDHQQWFVREVHAHDGQLRAYLRGSFPAVRDVDDVVQDSYLKVWKAKASEPIRSAKAFLFRIAKRTALDALRKLRRSPIDAIPDLDQIGVLQEGLMDPAVAAARLELKIELLSDAVAALPPRRREVLILRKFDLLSQKETAAKLGITERTVEKTLSNALKDCEAFFHTKGIHDFFSDEAR